MICIGPTTMTLVTFYLTSKVKCTAQSVNRRRCEGNVESRKLGLPTTVNQAVNAAS